MTRTFPAMMPVKSSPLTQPTEFPTGEVVTEPEYWVYCVHSIGFVLTPAEALVKDERVSNRGTVRRRVQPDRTGARACTESPDVVTSRS